MAKNPIKAYGVAVWKTNNQGYFTLDTGGIPEIKKNSNENLTNI